MAYLQVLGYTARIERHFARISQMAKAGKKYQEAAKLVEAGKLYTAAEAMELVKIQVATHSNQQFRIHIIH